MRFALFFVLAWNIWAADPLHDVRETGARLESERRWDSAAALYRAALQQYGPEVSTVDRFWLQMSLAEMAFNAGDYRQARQWVKQAEASLGNSPKLGDSWMRVLNARGSLHLVEGRLSAAERDLVRAVAAAKDATDSPALAGVLHNLASVEAQTGAVPLAREHQTKALALWRRQFGERHEYVRRAWISLSSIQGLGHDWAEAEESLRQALAIAETPDVLASCAVVLDHLGRGREAQKIRKRAPTTAAPDALIDVKALVGASERNQPRVVVR